MKDEGDEDVEHKKLENLELKLMQIAKGFRNYNGILMQKNLGNKKRKNVRKEYERGNTIDLKLVKVVKMSSPSILLRPNVAM